MFSLTRKFAPSWLPFQRILQRKKAVAISPEFLEWRQQFLHQRLALLCWVMLGITAIFGILLFSVAIPGLNASGDPNLMVSPTRIMWTIIAIAGQLLGLILTLILLKNPITGRYPGKLFFLASGSLVLLPQIISTFFGEATLDDGEWILFFSIQAILIPVCWRLHLFSQVSVLGLFLVKAFVFGMRDSTVSLPIAYISAATYTLMICTVADGGVYLYERALRKEFELRQQVQVFLHAVSHDLRNPILGTLMTLKALRTPGKPLAIPDALVEQMIESGDRQLQLINTLLEAHATETQGIQLHLQAINLDHLIQSVLFDLRPFLDEAKAQLTVAIAPQLPLIYADSLQLRRVYENLISNALKYNGTGLNLTLGADVLDPEQAKRMMKQRRRHGHSSAMHHFPSYNGWVRCTVSDNGVGMTQQQCDRLFDRYTRGTHARQTLGLGLGLYICRQIVEAHRGEMGVLSQLGHGTTFWFTVPATLHPPVES